MNRYGSVCRVKSGLSQERSVHGVQGSEMGQDGSVHLVYVHLLAIRRKLFLRQVLRIQDSPDDVL
jgi:hypothetical protein